jgi:ABC-type uncharacterized transport system ATPase subunit
MMKPDATGPSADGPMPATGAVAALITKAPGKEPYVVGKPNPMMFRSAMNKIGAHSENTGMIGDRMDTDIVAGIEAGLHTHGQTQWLEIGMLLMQDPELLMLDEPIAGMSVRERELTAELLNRICKGRSMIVIEHDMNFVRQIADKVTVMHQGKILAEGAMEVVQADPRVIDVYLGH